MSCFVEKVMKAKRTKGVGNCFEFGSIPDFLHAVVLYGLWKVDVAHSFENPNVSIGKCVRDHPRSGEGRVYYCSR